MKKGRRTSMGRFVALPYYLLESAAWQDLSPAACCVFIELKKRWNPNSSNNGRIGLSVREAAKVVRGGKDKASQALDELVAHGFIRMTNKGHMQNRHATEWLLTTEKDDRTNHPATNDWKHWKPPEKKSSVRSQVPVGLLSGTKAVNL